MMAVPIKRTDLQSGTPTKLFDTRYYAALVAPTTSPGTASVLMIKAAAGDSTPPSIVVVLNWVEELKARVPTK